MKRRLTVLVMLGMLPWAALHAQTSTSTTFRVSANVQAVCEVLATDLNFGNYASNSSTPLLGSTVIVATCSPTTTYQIGLNEGTSSGATINQRKMTGANATSLNYQLYSDSSRTVIWGNTQGTDTVTGAGTGVAENFTAYGTLPALQSVPPGIYSDTITVRVYY